MVAVVTKKEILKWKRRYPNLHSFGLIDDDFALRCITADKLGCRPCDVNVEIPTRGSVAVVSF